MWTWWSDLAAVETLKTRLDLGLATFGVITALLALFSWGVGARVARLQARDQDALKERVRLAQTSAEGMKNELDAAEKRHSEAQAAIKRDLEAAQRRLEQSGQQIESLQERTQPRILNKAQADQIVAGLARCSSRSLSLTAPMGDSEAVTFAQQLERLFLAAGWKSSGVSQAVFTGSPVGLIIRVPSKEQVHPCAAVIQSIFKAAGFDAPGEIVPGTKTDALDLVVGHKHAG